MKKYTLVFFIFWLGNPLIFAAPLPPTVSACTPAVSPCPTLTILQGASVVLNGYASSSSSDAISTVWRLAGGNLTVGFGAGIATFATSTSPVTTATFSDPGIYVLQLVAKDGVNWSTSTVTVNVTQMQVCSTTLYPGNDIELAVACNPAGTTFTIKPGLYRLQSIGPKTGDTFIGEPGALLSGAQLLANFSKEGSLWVASGPSVPGQVYPGICDAAHPACIYPEDFYIDNKPLFRVLSSTSVVSGSCFFDYADAKIYFADDPTGHQVEVSAARTAFEGAPAGTPVNNITIKNLIVEKYAIPAQMGAIGDQFIGQNWLVQDNEVRLNHGTGIRADAGGRILGNYVHDNGELGIGGNFIALVDSNEMAFNNYAGVSCGFECGGAKFIAPTGIVVTNNYVHDNLGDGLWDDIDSENVLYDHNTVLNNWYVGISHEISGTAQITNNIVKGNGRNDAFGWVWGGQIMIQNSSNTVVSSNTVQAAGPGNGITLIEQSRPDSGGPHLTQNNHVHDNDITILNSGPSWIGNGAWGADGLYGMYTSNTFDYNHYHLTTAANMSSYYYWQWDDPANEALGQASVSYTWAQLPALGLEIHGTLDTQSAQISTPTVTLTSPATNATYLSTAAFVVLQASASEADGQIMQVSFYENGNRIAISTAPPFAFTWTDVPPGIYQLTAAAVDMAGTSVTSSSATISIVNPPIVSISTPLAGSVLKGQVSVAGKLQTAPGEQLSEISLHVDSIPILSAAVVSSTSFQLTWDTTQIANGSHMLSVWAYDSTGLSNSQSITVQVANPITAPPLVTIVTPAPVASLQGQVQVRGTVQTSTSTTLIRTELDIDGQWNAFGQASPFQFVWDTTQGLNGSHQITVKAWDSAGATASQSFWVQVANTGAASSNGPQANWINVTQAPYNAVPDGSTDDTAAIQKALNASTSGQTVYFPPGIYAISASLRPLSNTKLIGAGQNQTTIQCHTPNPIDMIYLNTLWNVEITSMTLDGHYEPGVASGIHAFQGGGHFLHDLTVQNQANPSGSDGIFFNGPSAGSSTNPQNGVINSVIADNLIVNISTGSQWGIGISVGWGSSGNTIVRNTVSQVGRTGIDAGNLSMDLVIQHNVVSRSGLALTTNNGAPGIELVGYCNRSLVEDNVVDHWISVASGSNGGAVRRNTVSDSNSYGYIGLEMICSDCVATDNLIDSQQGYGIESTDSDNQYIAYNTVQQMNAGGLGVYSFGTSAAYPVIPEYLYFYGNKFLATQNLSSDGQSGYGVYFTGPSPHDVMFDSNTISGSALGGLAFWGGNDEISVVHNTLTNNGGAAVTTPFIGSSLFWSGNSVSGNKDNTQPASVGFPNPSPVAQFTWSGAPSAGRPVQFTNQSTTATGQMVRVLWDFNDGIPSTDQNPTHVFPSTGPYRVALIVWNDAGRASRMETNFALQPSNQTPQVNAGPNQTVPLSNYAVLNGTATDDGLPYGILSTTWSLVSGPAPVVFSSTHTPITNAGFLSSGTYILQLSVSDGQLSSTSQTTITVSLTPPIVSVPNLGSANPSVVTAGDPGYSLIVHGANLESGCTAYWNGLAIQTNFVSATQVTASVPASFFVSVGTASVQIVNPDGGISNSLTIGIVPPPRPPDLSGWPSFITMNGNLNLPSQPDSTYQWTFTPEPVTFPSAVRATGPSFGSSASTLTQAPALSLSSLALNPGPYGVQVLVINAAGKASSPAQATITLVASSDDLSGVRVYPNPFRSARGDRQITFDQMSAGGTVKIFTVSARLVTTLSAPAGLVSWPLTNDSGDIVASGIYLYVITDGLGNKSRGKVTVIR